jgi:hypothetical protein
LDRVVAQIHRHLVHLGSVADQEERHFGGACLQTDARGERAADQLERLRHDCGKVNGHTCAALGSAVGVYDSCPKQVVSLLQSDIGRRHIWA